MTDATAAKGEQNLHILSVLVENRFGVLSRIAGLFSPVSYTHLTLPTSDLV